MPEGVLVAIEGIDGAGKGTQTGLLEQWAERRGLSVARIAFPRYEGSLYGALCTRYLRGEFGSVGDLSPFLVALPYAGDRLEAAPLIRRELARRDLIILDRYVGSNIAHQGAKLPLEALAGFAGWVEQLEYGVHGIPRPAATLLLDMPVESARELMRSRGRALHGGGTDIHESNVEYLLQVAVRYQWLAQNLPGWTAIACTDGSSLREPETIADELTGCVARLLGP